mmetsp:Transcript_26628/g.82940  ORF Transcript_26628/g.82940 Transcript_26628/m.82940 type:complete len:255 (-) Transcript_26628:116-880(-)
MPVELWLDCVCSHTRPGDELLAVGDSPSLGSWSAERGVALVTSPASFPRWSFRQPLKILDNPATLTVWIQYKYVIRRGDGSLSWEDLGVREATRCACRRRGRWARMTPGAACGLKHPQVPSLCPWSSASGLLGVTIATKPLNRCLAGGCYLHRPHNIMLRLDEFGRHEPVVDACWAVSPGWAPALAGCDAQLRALVQLKGAWPTRSCEDLALRAFVLPRLGRLRGCLEQLVRCRYLPASLWKRIAGFVGGALLS